VVAIRWFRWINFPLLEIMIWSGLLIYWAYPVYVAAAAIGGYEWLRHSKGDENLQ
jgi:hypothetical protein